MPTATLPSTTPPTITSRTDPADLLRRAAAGHADAWAAIVDRHTPMLRGRVRRYRLQEADAHDAVQATWLRLAQNLDRIHTPAHLAGWLAAVASRECLRILHDKRRAVVTAEAGYATADPGTGPEQLAVDTLTRAEAQAAVARAVATLPPRRRALLQALFADDGRSYAEISREIGIPVGSIGPTRARVLAQLRRELGREAALRADRAFVGPEW